MRTLFPLVALLMVWAAPSRAALPEFYKSVDRVIWVVENADQTMQQLRNIGFTNLQDLGEHPLGRAEVRGRPASGTCRFVSGRFGDVTALWIQPYGGENAFAEFLAKHRTGVFSLMHRVPSQAAFEDEVTRMGKHGAGILMRGAIQTDSGEILWTFFDTKARGKYILGIIHFPDGDEGPLAVPESNPSGKVITQYAFAVKKLEPVSEYWASLSFPPMEFTHGKLSDLRYQRKPAHLDMRLGWQRHGKVVYEWIQSLQGPNVYLDHMKVHGEGLHHIAFQADDIDAAIAWWTSKGHPESMSGAWGEKGKPGSGRFAYVDAQSMGGTDIELLWNYKGD